MPAENEKPEEETETPEPEQEAPELTWDGFISEQSEEVQALFAGNVKGLKSALASERDTNKDFSHKIKELGSQAEEGTELRTRFDKLTTDIEASNNRGDFFEAAADPALGLQDAGLAWIAVSGNQADFIRRGKVDFDGLKVAHPTLFEAPKQKQLNSQAGAGTRTPPPTKSVNEQMNDFMRGNK